MSDLVNETKAIARAGGQGGDEGKQTEGPLGDRVDFIKGRLKFHIEDYKTKRDKARWRANVNKVLVIAFGGLITLLLGVKSSALLKPADEVLSIVALLISTMLTALNSWEAFADHRGKWIRSRTTLVSLYDIRDDLRYRLSGAAPLGDADLADFYQRLKMALYETNEEWMTNRGKALTGAPAAEAKRE